MVLGVSLQAVSIFLEAVSLLPNREFVLHVIRLLYKPCNNFTVRNGRFTLIAECLVLRSHIGGLRYSYLQDYSFIRCHYID